MQVGLLSVFLLVSSPLLFSSVVCGPNHHHKHNNDFPWQNILSSLGIVVENQTGVVSNSDASAAAPVGSKEHYTSEATVEVLKSEAKDGTETPVVAQNGTVEVSSSSSSGGSSGLGVVIGVPIVGIIFFVLFCYCLCKCCSACCEKETPGVVIMQSNTVQNQQPAAPQIILQQPIINQHAPPTYDAQQKWAHPPPQGPPQWNQPPPQGPSQWNQPPPQGHQWNQPPQGPPQWAPHPMSDQQHYSPNSGYDNAGFNPGTAPPPYNPGKY